MVFYCPKCEKHFTNHNDIIPKDSVIGQTNGVETGIYHVRGDCGNYLALWDNGAKMNKKIFNCYCSTNKEF